MELIEIEHNGKIYRMFEFIYQAMKRLKKQG